MGDVVVVLIFFNVFFCIVRSTTEDSDCIDNGYTDINATYATFIRLGDT